jgi:bifunctional non-homologous end joining protein LigD
VENCLASGDPDSLVFDASAVLERVKSHGDLFEPVLKLKQKLPRVEALQVLEAGGARATAARPLGRHTPVPRTPAKTKRSAAKKAAAPRKSR